jgi:hypothetical protein
MSALDKEMAKLAAMGVTVNVKLANPNADSPFARIQQAAVAARIDYDPNCAACKRDSGTMSPPHTASTSCESGGSNHCTCDRCF